jgi:hypothetical protein
VMIILPPPVGTSGAWPVRIGALWHSAWDLENVLQKYCKQIFALTGDPQFPYCLLGSATAIQFANRHFVFCCRHQIRDYQPDEIAVPLSFETRIMSASGLRQLEITDANRDGDTIDVAVFEFNVQDYGVPNLGSEFLCVDDSRVWPTGASQLPFMVFGYPSAKQIYDETRIGARSIEVHAAYDGGTSSPHLHRIVLEKPYDADGMSGGPVFYIGGGPGTYFVGWAGIAMRGGQNSRFLHFMAADFLLEIALDPASC